MEQANIQKAEQPKEKGPSIFDKLKNRIANYKRVIDVARKPTREEFLSSAKITGSGIAIIGLIGFVIFLMYFLVVK